LEGANLVSAGGLGSLVPSDSVPAAFATTLAESFAQRVGDRFAVLLSGGPTAAACYEAAAELGPDSIDWTLVDIYMGDERIVPPDDPNANQLLVRQRLIEKVGGVGSFMPMPTTEKPDECADEYQQVIKELLGGPGIDMIHLGLGPDGHTASLFSGSPALEAGPQDLVLATEDPNGVNHLPRLTVTLPVINQARLAVFTVAGKKKAGALGRVREGDDVPANRVRAQKVRWLVDAGALGLSQGQ